MPRLSKILRERAIGMIEAGMRTAEIARRIGTHRKTIWRLANRLRTTGSTDDRPRSGRPRVTTRAQDRYIVTSHLRDRFLTAVETARNTRGRTNNRISAQTVRRRLRERGLRARRPYVGIVLLQRHRLQRLRWARQQLRRNRLGWRNILFSDESRFTLTRSDGRTRVYRRKNERYADACVEERDRFGGGGSVMVWAGIMYNYRTALVQIRGNLNAAKYCGDVLTNHVLPYVNAHPNVTFQQDNATSHTARQTRLLLQANNVNVLDWPAKSPDLNPIEHLWDELDRRIRSRPVQPNNERELWNALVYEWNNIPRVAIRTLIDSMRRRCNAVITARGGHTKY